jgi:hypothetical protein
MERCAEHAPPMRAALEALVVMGAWSEQRLSMEPPQQRVAH